MAHNLHDYWIITTDVDYADEAGAFVVGVIPAKTLVLGSAVIVTTAYVGTSPTLDLGDEDDADEFVANAAVTATTAAAYMSMDGSADKDNGGYYSAAKNIILTLGGTSLTAGVAYGVLHCLDLSDSV